MEIATKATSVNWQGPVPVGISAAHLALPLLGRFQHRTEQVDERLGMAGTRSRPVQLVAKEIELKVSI